MSEKFTDFEELVKEMRALQKAYFRTRSPETLQAAKRLEREVDAFIKHRLEEIAKERLEANMEFDFMEGWK